ncbi:MAG: hypothetical protein QOF62_120 [Pyrinomonadaceae bacterium]|jgi:hypothetical protein|nr:hypothetical protein [Pyrinomonadaceae bacterium]
MRHGQELGDRLPFKLFRKIEPDGRDSSFIALQFAI